MIKKWFQRFRFHLQGGPIKNRTFSRYHIFTATTDIIMRFLLKCSEITAENKKLPLVVFCCNFWTLQQKPHDYICSGCKNMVSQKCAVFIGPPCITASAQGLEPQPNLIFYGSTTLSKSRAEGRDMDQHCEALIWPFRQGCTVYSNTQ